MGKDLLIGEFAARTGVDVRTIRYYEQVGVLPKPKRKKTGYASAGYRLYSEQDVERLRLIKGARLLDLSLAEIRQILVSLNGRAARPGLRQLLAEKLEVVNEKMKDLHSLRDRLEHVKNVTAQEKVKAQGSCCDPLCGPEICPPPLVRTEGGRRGGPKTRNRLARR